jgi:hypothetical protein
MASIKNFSPRWKGDRKIPLWEEKCEADGRALLFHVRATVNGASHKCHGTISRQLSNQSRTVHGQSPCQYVSKGSARFLQELIKLAIEPTKPECQRPDSTLCRDKRIMTRINALWVLMGFLVRAGVCRDESITLVRVAEMYRIHEWAEPKTFITQARYDGRALRAVH